MKWVYPCKAKKKKLHSDLVIENVVSNLRGLDFPVNNLISNRCSEDLEKALKPVVNSLKKRRWLLLVSNSLEFLKSISNVVLVGYALGEAKSVYKTTTSQIVELCLAGLPSTIWDPDEAGELLHRIKTSYMLSISGCDIYVKGGAKNESGYFDILSYRQEHGLYTIFNYVYAKKWSKSSMSDVFSALEHRMGSSISHMIYSNSEMITLNKTLPTPNVLALEI
jgi:hypothetical protein